MATDTLFDPVLSEGSRVSDLCPNCTHRTSLQLVFSETVWPAWARSAQPEDNAYSILHTFECMYCRKTCVVRHHFADRQTGESAYRAPAESVVIWPERAPRELPAEAPAEVRSLYREASMAENVGALRGAAGLLRACVEELVNDRKAQGGNLKAKINDLANQGVDADLITDLHDARLTGNWSLHDAIPFGADEVADIATLIEDAVEILYVQPARRAALAAARTARRQGQQP